jgi:hypothetical protein
MNPLNLAIIVINNAINLVFHYWWVLLILFAFGYVLYKLSTGDNP